MAFSPPNMTHPGNRLNSSGPTGWSAGGVNPPNHGPGGDGRGGSFPLGGTTGVIQPPNHGFAVSSSKMPQPPSAIEPGKGAVPVEPFGPSGQPRAASVVPDMRPPRR